MTHKIKSYFPLPDYLTIKKSKLHGLGLFATKDISSGQHLGITHVPDQRFTDGYIRTPLGGFINYSSKPSCNFFESKGMWELKTARPIKSGEELTAEYEEYDKEVLAAYN